MKDIKAWQVENGELTKIKVDDVTFSVEKDDNPTSELLSSRKNDEISIYEMIDGQITKLKIRKGIFSVDSTQLKEGEDVEDLADRFLNVFKLYKDLSKEETPSEETPSEETPSEETPSEETPSEETPSEETKDGLKKVKKETSQKKFKKQKGHTKEIIKYPYTKIGEQSKKPIHKEVVDEILNNVSDGFTADDVTKIVRKMYHQSKFKTIQLKAMGYVQYLHEHGYTYVSHKIGNKKVYGLTGEHNLDKMKKIELEEDKVKRDLIK